MIWRIEIKNKEEIPSAKAKEVKHELELFGYGDVEVEHTAVFLVDIETTKENIDLIAREVLADPVTENYIIKEGMSGEKGEGVIEITLDPGVMDPIALTVEKAINDLGVDGLVCVKTSQRYVFIGSKIPEKDEYKKFLFNPINAHIMDYEKATHIRTLNEFADVEYEFEKIEVDLMSADDAEMMKLSKEGCLSLTLDEMHAIKEYFITKGRNPTDIELEILAQTWSEHCNHKTFRGLIEYEETDEKGETKKELIDNLIKTTIFKATNDLNHPDCVSVFKDNAGIMKFTDKMNLCFKAETHNHPSALEPYGGASTGLGGVIRDILGVGCGGYPVANTDVFCFGNPDMPKEKLPEGTLHPHRIIKGVVSGVRDYGNKMGIPTVNGAVVFDERYTGNPLVYCGSIGIIPADKTEKTMKKDDLIVALGGRTGKDGIHGATFSSVELDGSEVESLSTCVQIGNPIEEKKIMAVIKRCMRKTLWTALTDCGAGGFSSSVGEITEEHGCKIELTNIPLKYSGLTYSEMWISESQERMVMVVPEENLSEFQQICEEEEVELVVLGEVTDTHRLELFYDGHQVADLDMEFMHDGTPRLKKTAQWTLVQEEQELLEKKEDYTEDVEKLFGQLNIASKAWVVNQYDHEVQGGSVIKPFMNDFGPQDAAVIRPMLDEKKCVAISNGINPFYGDIDPYHMTALVIDEALRNITSVGAPISKTSILDNFSWPSPDDPKNLGALVRSSKACYDYGMAFGVPFISGKDSLYNEYMDGDKRIMIPYTLLISAMSVIEDSSKTTTSSFKQDGSLIYVVGLTKDELGASEYFRMKGKSDGVVPKVDAKRALNTFNKLCTAINNAHVNACHDISDGGLALAAAEMCFGNKLGCELFLDKVLYEGQSQDDLILFSESASRFVVEVLPENKEKFEESMKSVDISIVGCVTNNNNLTISGIDGQVVVDAKIDKLKKVWSIAFENKLEK